MGWYCKSLLCNCNNWPGNLTCVCCWTKKKETQHRPDYCFDYFTLTENNTLVKETFPFNTEGLIRVRIEKEKK